jgi:hypothetical protein
MPRMITKDRKMGLFVEAGKLAAGLWLGFALWAAIGYVILIMAL